MNNQPTVLVIDDEWLNRELIEGLLSVFDYNVLLANGGESALKILGHESPDLIVMDVRMPGMDGYELCRAVKSNPKTAHIPVIMITALELNAEEIQKITDAGADDIVSRMTLTRVLLDKIGENLVQKVAS
ncbi:MAG: response regulator [Anaerolineae bacterium]|jgi:CheY-like chemotaxis protein|nr:response regulator [Anaerolineae bacterium]